MVQIASEDRLQFNQTMTPFRAIHHGYDRRRKFRFDLNGYLLREALLTPDEIAEIKDQVERMQRDPQSLEPHERAVPGGASQLLIDHPKVIEVLHEIIGPQVRLEGAFSMVRAQGERHGDLHGGGPQQIDPIFGYRVQNGRIHAGMVRVAFELTDMRKDGATVYTRQSQSQHPCTRTAAHEEGGAVRFCAAIPVRPAARCSSRKTCATPGPCGSARRRA